MENDEIAFDIDEPVEGVGKAASPDDPKRTYVLYVLDQSGSMSVMKRTVLDGFNEHLREIKRQAAKGGDTRVGLVVFDDNASFKMWNSRAEDVFPLRDAEYRPGGSTAMLDAVGRAIDRARDLPGFASPNASFLCIILSDGYENASRTETYETIRTKVEALQETGRWEFAYIGSNQDLSRVREQTGIVGGVSFAPTMAGMRSVVSASGSALSGYFDARSNNQVAPAGAFSATTQSTYNSTMAKQPEPDDALGPGTPMWNRPLDPNNLTGKPRKK